MKLIFSLIIVLFLCLSCKKDKGIADTSGVTNTPAVNYTPFIIKCDTLPPEPIGLGWIDTTADENRDVKFWAYNPANNDEIIYIANYQLWSYNLNTKIKKYLDKNIGGIPQINKDGWVVYGKVNFNIYIVKTNGDSLKQINSTQPGQMPQWDYIGKNVYYFQNGSGPIPSLVVKVNKSGVKVDSIPSLSISYAFAKTSDNYLYGSGNSIYWYNATNHMSTIVATDPLGFDHLTLDKTDENMYWWNNNGLYKLNLSSLKRDTIVTYCANFMISALNISPNSSKLTFCFTLRQQVVKPWKLLREDKPIELDLVSNKYQELLIKF